MALARTFRLGLLDAVAHLLEHGADLNRADHRGATPLLPTTPRRDRRAVVFCLHHDADLRAQTSFG